MNLLQGLYRWGLEWDRRRTAPLRLPRPVVSVGNIAVGGRGKTPFVIHLARLLQEQGWEPVVLTRGYGRRSRAPVLIEKDAELPTVEAVGDEALEIFLSTGAEVLVGPRRDLNALDWLARRPAERVSKAVFLLDDGFQHWRLQRDFDLVLTAPEDHQDSLLPTGRLRESPEALRRAHRVLERGRDFIKISILRAAAQLPADQKPWVLTTRAPDAAYLLALARALNREPRSFETRTLADHASVEDSRRALNEIPAGRPVLVGLKEAVKLLEGSDLRELVRTGRRDSLFLVDCELRLTDPPALSAALLGTLQASASARKGAGA